MSVHVESSMAKGQVACGRMLTGETMVAFAEGAKVTCRTCLGLIAVAHARIQCRVKVVYDDDGFGDDECDEAPGAPIVKFPGGETPPGRHPRGDRRSRAWFVAMSRRRVYFPGQTIGRFALVRRVDGLKFGVKCLGCGRKFVRVVSNLKFRTKAGSKRGQPRIQESRKGLMGCRTCANRALGPAKMRLRLCRGCGTTEMERFGKKATECMACERARQRNGACVCGRPWRKMQLGHRFVFRPCLCGDLSPAVVSADRPVSEGSTTRASDSLQGSTARESVVMAREDA